MIPQNRLPSKRTGPPAPPLAEDRGLIDPPPVAFSPNYFDTLRAALGDWPDLPRELTREELTEEIRREVAKALALRRHPDLAEQYAVAKRAQAKACQQHAEVR